MLEDRRFDNEFIEKVVNLVEHHEEGGNDEANVLMDADSISYFDYNIDKYFAKNGYEKTVKKAKYMYNRSSDRARKYNEGIKFEDEIIKNIMKEVVK